MGFFGFLFAMIVFSTVLTIGGVVVAGRYAIKGGRRLLGWARHQHLLSGTTQQDTREAQDVVIEDVDDVSYGRPSAGPVPPREAAEAHRRARRTPKPAQREGYVRLDVDKGTTADQVADVMLSYIDDPVLGERAQTVIDTLDSAEHRKRSLFAELDGTFQPGSISWDKFSIPSQAALDAILRNAAQLANRIQAFDTAGYQRLFKSVQRDAMGEHSGAANRAERMRLYQEMLASLDALQETNEGLLLELEKLTGELVGISSAEQADRGDPIFDEISRLVEEAKYYREAR